MRIFEEKQFNHLDNTILLIASENYPSENVLKASGSIFQLPYSEGFPGKRYYQGTQIVDEMESECINKCLQLFKAEQEYEANVQPNSGASANMIVYNAILDLGDTVLAMDVKAGGHISHSHPKSFLGKYHNLITYGVNDNGLLDYDNIRELALKHKPKLIICGASNYSRVINFKKFKQIADEVGAFLMADIAHLSALVAHGLHPSPVGLADFITSTTHKSLRGPRGAFILYKKEFRKQINLSTIPGLFGGPLEHQIYAKLVCFNEMLQPEAKDYARRIIENAKEMESVFKDHNFKLVADGTDNHLMTLDLSNFEYTGKQIAGILEECGVIVNCNTVPNDLRSFMDTSGIRIGTPAITSRGLMSSDVRVLANSIANLITLYQKEGHESEKEYMKAFLKQVIKILSVEYSLKDIYPEMTQNLLKEIVK